MKLSSKRGISCTSFLVGYLYEVGQEIQRDMNESFKYYERSSMQEDSKGLYKIVYCYYEGVGVKVNYIIAREYFEKAAELGDVNALYNLRSLYRNGKVEQDYNKELEYFDRLLYGRFWILFTITVFLLDDFGYLLQHSKNSIRE